MTDDVRVTLEAVPRTGLSEQRLRQAVAEHPEALAALEVADPGRLTVAFAPGLGHDPGENAPFQATVFDPVGNRAVELRGTLDRPERAELRPSAFRPPPSREELVAAAAILRADPRFPAGDDVVVYRPMPPLADAENPDGTTVRRPTLGLYTPGEPTGLRHRIVAVDLAARSVDWTPAGINVRMHHDCEDGVPVGVDALADRGGPDQVRVRVHRGGTELWNLLVARPRASAPAAPAWAAAWSCARSATAAGSCCGRRTCPSSTSSTTRAPPSATTSTSRPASAPPAATPSAGAGGCAPARPARSWNARPPTPATSRASPSTTTASGCASSASWKPAGTATPATGGWPTTARSCRASGSPPPATR
ncbi:hypothetical protein ACFQQB_60895 [Nonomuraea rubra]|uniref:hypothetical protein n=1 Tax=Nonomuraea rubra TaxID=46180 RepID=UPI00360E8F35